MDQTQSYANQRNEGEGNKTAAREYNEAQHDFVASGRVEEKAQEAARAMNSPERVELERAEAIGRGRAQPGTAEMLAQRAKQHAARIPSWQCPGVSARGADNCRPGRLRDWLPDPWRVNAGMAQPTGN